MGQQVQAKELELAQVLNRPQPAPIEVVEEVRVEPPPELLPSQIGDHPHADPPPIGIAHVPLSDHEHDPVPINARISQNQIVIPDFSINTETVNPVNAGFGDTFPIDPIKGDMFLRVDMLPSKLFKWNEKKWIEVDKTKTDSFAYDRAYIQHLVEKIDTGEYDVELLTDSESEQIKEYLNEQSKK